MVEKVVLHLFFCVVLMGGRIANSNRSGVNKRRVSFWPSNKPLES
jgi:hypothetical protein